MLQTISRILRTRLTKATVFCDKNLWKCICLCAVVSLLSFSGYIYLDGGVFVLRDDFNAQQIMFSTALNGTLKQWSGEWCWNVDLGTQLVGGYSFYNLGSPFFWISLIFHKNLFPYIVGIIYMLKYIIAGSISYLYIKRFVNDSKYAIVGSLLYAFSGFQCENLLFYHFHDVVAFFPLILLGLERALQEKKYALFIFSVFINCLVNYFFFVGEVIFLVLYFFCRFWGKPKNMFRNATICIVSGGLGVGMASVLFIPSILFICGNSRSELQIYLESLLPSTQQFFYYLKGLLLPGEAMHNESCIVNQSWLSTSCYLPLVGISLPLAYILKKKDWLTKLFVILLGIAFSPLLSSAFYMFTTNYQRWWYMLILIMSVMSAVVLERRADFPVKRAICVNAIMVALLFLSLTKLKWSRWTESVIYRETVFRILVGISLAGLLWMFMALRSSQKYYVSMLTGISAACIVTTSLSIYLYRQDTISSKDYMHRYKLGAQLKNLDDQYRYNIIDNVPILSGDAIGVWSFNSTKSPSIFEFNETFGYESTNFSLDVNSIPGLRQLVAAKYKLVENINETNEVADIIDVDGKKYYIVTDTACPIGFAYDSYILQEDLAQIAVENRGVAALDNLVVSAEDEYKVIPIITKNSPSDYVPDEKYITEITKKNSKNSVKNFYRDNGGFECETDYDTAKAVYFTVPYDAGWKAFIDDREEEIIKTNGMMTLIVPEGEHQIVFYYKTPGIMQGIWISTISFIVFIAYLFYRRREHVTGQQIFLP